MKETLCPVCRSASCDVMESVEPPHRLLRCRRCTLVFVAPAPDTAVLAGHYGPDYYAEWISRQAGSRRRMWDRRMSKIERRKPSGRLLDIGCGAGCFLQTAMTRGWRVFGTELSPYAAALASERTGRSIFAGQVWDAGLPEQSFDVVTLWHVLEHTSEPARTLQAAERLMKPDGLLVVAVPNFGDRLMQFAYRLARGHRPVLFSMRAKEIHLLHFTVTSLSVLLEKTGFHPLSIGPDFGVVGRAKQVINGVSALVFYLAGVHWYNAIEVFARKSWTQTHGCAGSR